MLISIAIDGPIGVGKSTTARKTAELLGFTYIDTGAMYRAAALYLLEKGLNIHSETVVSQALPDIVISLSHVNGEQRVFLGERDVSEVIRTQEVAEAASIVASYTCVREKLVAVQKQMAKSGNVVMDGRDIGSKVLPNAQVKIYLDASLEVRTQRRADDLKNRGKNVDFEEVKCDIMVRDERDMTRFDSPLVCVNGADKIDTSYMTIEEVAERIAELARMVM